MDNSNKITIGSAIIVYMLLKNLVLGDMPVSDKLNLIDTMGSFRKIASDFEVTKSDIVEKMPESTEEERREAIAIKANEIIDIPEIKKINEASFGCLLEANKSLSLQQAVSLKQVLC